MSITSECRNQAEDLVVYLDASPSPWHAVAAAVARLRAGGFVCLDEKERWRLEAGGRYFVVRGGSSLVAFIVGTEAPATAGLRLVGAHTDSPGLRLKPRPAQLAEGVVRLGVEIYGGPLLATFADRDLALAGRVAVRAGAGVEMRLLRFAQPMLRLPNLAIHMNREVNDKGLRFDKQNELPLLFAMAAAGTTAEAQFMAAVAHELQVEADAILSWDLNVYDTQPAAIWGLDREFIASGRLDNLASCHAALCALSAAAAPAASCVCALFDHEEVGSESSGGAEGSFLTDVLARLFAQQKTDDEDRRRALARSFFLSADMAHAWQPNFPAAYEPGHRVQVNAGIVLKTNANQRYSGDADSAARLLRLGEAAGVPVQRYVHRSDLACGSTIGPLLAAALGVAGVDIGAPLWAMHSIRESAGVRDHGDMIAVLAALFNAREP